MEHWLNDEAASLSLRQCANDVLRVLVLSSGCTDSEHWGIEMLVIQLKCSDDTAVEITLDTLTEIAETSYLLQVNPSFHPSIHLSIVRLLIG